MENLPIKYSAYAGALPPQPIRLANVTWAGKPEKMEDGSDLQPWHCLPFVEGSTYGLELVYPYETECHVVGDAGTFHFEFDYAKEPGGLLTGGEFLAFSPSDGYKYYTFNTRLDLRAPPGYVLRSEPHPRYFTEDSDTVPLAMIGHVQTEWFPHLIFLVFRGPRQGQRQIFRKGEPYAQILFVPRVKFEPVKMSDEEAFDRRALEDAIEGARLDISDHVWHNRAGSAFGNYYKVLVRAFARDGEKGVREVVDKAVERQQQAFPLNKPIAECMALAAENMRKQKFALAQEIYAHVLERDPNNAPAYSALGVCFAARANHVKAHWAMERAVALQPGKADYHTNFGESLRRQGRLEEAETAFRTALALTPGDPEFLSVLGMTLAQQGRLPEALETYGAAVQRGPNLPQAHYGLGMVYVQLGEHAKARACFEAVLAMAPAFAPARHALQELPHG